MHAEVGSARTVVAWWELPDEFDPNDDVANDPSNIWIKCFLISAMPLTLLSSPPKPMCKVAFNQNCLDCFLL